MDTIKDVAKLAGVSVATVSRVVNGTGNVKEETRLAVEEAIRELQYSPNGLGRNLRRLETKKILVVLSTISNQFYSRVVRGIEEKAMESGYSVLLGTTRDKLEQLRLYFDMIQTKQVDGAIFMATHFHDPRERELLEMKYPVVCACEPAQVPTIPYVGIDDAAAAMDATEYLLSCGHRQIALLCAGTVNDSGSSFQREQGYCTILRQRNLPVREDWIMREGLTYNAGKRAGRRFLQMKERPEAVFSCSDAAAIGFVHELEKNQVHVPDEVSVIGFDNTAMSEIFLPTVTTVAQPQYEIGQTAMELLLEKMTERQGTIYAPVVLPHKIICRDSVKMKINQDGKEEVKL